MAYLLSHMVYVWNWHENSIFKKYSHVRNASVLLINFFLQNCPATAYYVPYSCQCRDVLKCDPLTYNNIWPNQHKFHGPNFWNSILNTSRGITLYFNIAVFCLLVVSGLVTMTDHMTLKLKRSDYYCDRDTVHLFMWSLPGFIIIWWCLMGQFL